MNVHDAEHERLLEDLIAGRSPLDADAERRLADCAECTRAWNELRELELELGGAAGEQAKVLREVAASPDRRAAEDVVRRFVEGVRPELPVRTASATHRGRPRWVLLTSILATAAAVLVAITLWRTDGPTERQEVFLHGTDRLKITTVGPIRDTLEWVYDVEAEAQFEVIVRDAADPSSVVGEPKIVYETKCTWTAEELQAWPALVRIEVVASTFSNDEDLASYTGWRE